MNSEQYKRWYKNHAKHLQEIRKLDSYDYMVEVFCGDAVGHMMEYYRDTFDEFIIEILGTVHDLENERV